MHRLDGLRIVVTRASHQAEELAAPLRALGAEVILLPVIGIAGPADRAPLRQAAAQCNTYDWIIFTSANAVSAFAAELPDAPAAEPLRIAAVGAATARTAEQHGFRVTKMPAKYVAESLVELFQDQNLSGARILIPSAAVTRDVVATELRKRGAHVHMVEAYRNVIPEEAAEKAEQVFREPYPDWITFASPSAVENLVRVVGVEWLRHSKIASIGPITSEAIRKCGLTVDAEATVQTVAGLVETLAAA